jgi:hypothetical protein
MVLATSFVIWYMTVGYRIGTFGPETRLGSVYIGGLTEQEVIPLMDERITYWYNDDTIVFRLSYQDYVYEFDRDLLLFDLQLSTYDLKDGVTNELLAYYQSEDLDRIRQEIDALPFLQDVKDNLNVTALIQAMLNDAALMKSFSDQKVEEYLIDYAAQEELLHTATFRVPEGADIDDVIADVATKYEGGRIPISGQTLFDLLGLLGGTLNDQELTMLASAMLDGVLYTNFIVNEVHYESEIDFSLYTIDNYPYFGRNARINRVVGQGFNFYNPNVADYYFTIEKIDEFNGRVNLLGLPFEYDIQVEIQTTEVPYTTRTTSDVTRLQFGYNGVIVEVERRIIDVNGTIVEEDVILFEFYPPITEIIFQP